jgi:hypothetical protein
MIVLILDLESVYEWNHVIVCLAYFSQYDNTQFNPFPCKQHNLILFCMNYAPLQI